MDGYPKIKYHSRGGGSITVTTAAQEKALGPEWIDNKAILAHTPPPEPEKKRGRPPRVTNASS